MESAPAGVIYLSMGSSVRSARLPAALCQLFVAVLARLSCHHVLLTWASNTSELPQQDILRYLRLKLFITHGGLLSQHAAVFHGVPLMLLPDFCDHGVNSAQAPDVHQLFSSAFGFLDTPGFVLD
ncbi:hypothetical protein ACLKA7_008049 [Drosophila subpalustris]